MKTNRKELLSKLESLAPGLARQEDIEQSTSFVFRDGRAATFNDEITCSVDVPLDIAGAVPAKPLLSCLKKFKEEDLTITLAKGKLVVKGKEKRARIRCEAEVVLPIDSVKMPDKWKKLPKGFGDAIRVVHTCASKDVNDFRRACVHIHPEHIEACDNIQAARWPLKTNIGKACLVRRESINRMTDYGMTEFGVTTFEGEGKNVDTWIHFRNPDGLVKGCRLWLEDYDNLDDILDVKGSKAVLPKQLAEAVGRAEIFTGEDRQENIVRVELTKERLRLKGSGAYGDYEERQKVEYGGEPIAFCVEAPMLVELCRRTDVCEISSDRVKVETDKFVWIACLGVPEEEDE